ncbi:MAG: polymer-forming cytoskeletal protein [Candidatus Tectomicrobia bacterium]|uniref:Polymer-forming cytoskeletal protein n=1 Tax=Tectimicrobiota bacterium TaxID=2528274 RepID=A0A932MMT3_UNCTE|nr:polymer-forming cytoskeletal protein [Candidatus Tectomicrobia bacterium]
MSIFSREKELEQHSSPAAAAPVVERGRAEKQAPQAKIGKTIVIRGELSGGEDLIIEGRVEGHVDLKDHHLVIGEGGNLTADVEAKKITVIGRLEGNLNAKERVEIMESGSVVGDIRAPRLAIADGGKFKGSVDMTGERAAPAGKEKKDREPVQLQPKGENGAHRPLEGAVKN